MLRSEESTPQPSLHTVASDLLCYSHVRWDFVFQRPQHLMMRFARTHRVFFIEDPVPDERGPRLQVRRTGQGITIVVARLTPAQLANGALAVAAQRRLLDELVVSEDIQPHVAWYYTPMALAASEHLGPRAVVYDCMDELARQKGAPEDLAAREARLFSRADLVLTDGQSLYEAKCLRHPRVFCFPSSVDVAHFLPARGVLPDPPDQRIIGRPRLGFAGVIDERVDLALVAAVAAARPGWQLVLLGPVVNLDTGSLPRAPNLHYLGGKPYDQMPDYLAGWDVAMLPFLRNEATRFLNPIKTPEYLAAGRPVVSTSIRDVVRPYGKQGLVHIADDPRSFVAAVEAAQASNLDSLRARADHLLSRTSWDRTAGQMAALVADSIRLGRGRPTDRSAAI